MDQPSNEPSTGGPSSYYQDNSSQQQQPIGHYAQLYRSLISNDEITGKEEVGSRWRRQSL